MKDMETIVLEGNEYMIVAEMKINDVNYIHFAKVENPADFCIRKIRIIDGKEMIVGLDSRGEFNMALRAFSDKHLKDLEN